MAAIPPPQGMSETDYDAIEEAVTETVRGRWFLREFARRTQLAETRQLLDAMARIESAIFSNQDALPSADPSVRLLIQRIKEIASQLGVVAMDMREAGIETRFVEAVDGQARAVAGMMRSPPPRRAELLPDDTGSGPRAEPTRVPLTRPPAPQPLGTNGMPVIPPPATRVLEAVNAASPSGNAAEDPRLAALSRLDGMSAADKLTLFT